MIGRIIRWSYANARLRSCVGGILSEARHRELATFSFDQAERALTTVNPYGITLTPPLPPRLLHPYEDHYRRLTTILSGSSRQVFTCFLEAVAVDDLKTLIRRIIGLPINRSLPGINRTVIVSSLLPAGIETTRSLDDLASFLRGTPYAAPFRAARRSYAAGGRSLIFDVALDKDLHRRQEAAIRDLRAPDSHVVRRLFRRRSDLINLESIVRFRFVHDLDEVEIFNHVLPGGLDLKDDIVHHLARAADLDRIPAILQSTRLGPEIRNSLQRVFGAAPRPLGLADVEDAVTRLWLHIHEQLLIAHPFGLAPFLAYLALKERERFELERLLTALRLGVDPAVFLPQELRSREVGNGVKHAQT